MTILEFFDVYNYNHLMAYKHLSNKGVWPEGFIDDSITYPDFWQTMLMQDMVKAWIIHNEECFSGD